ncbi:MAG: N-acetylmuramoyl-L-alanine [Planctomycetota bacterium]|nr:MAG: N-acetylmuramoyl-L-alanine [Planctomycetota bacterium]
MKHAWVVLCLAAAAQAGPPKPGTIWDASPNFTPSSRESSYNIDSIVIHTTEGVDTNGDGYFSESYTQAISWFNNPAAGASAHYVVAPWGEITQMVADDDIAWHATYYNSRSIGIECAGFAGKAGTWTPELVDALAALVAYLCDAYAVSAVHPAGNAYSYADSKYKGVGLVGHNQVQPWDRTDPGSYFPWSSLVEKVIALLAGEPPATPSIISPAAGAELGSSAVFLDWSWVSGIDYYYVVVYDVWGTAVFDAWPTVSSASASLASGTYSWYVWAHNAAGWSGEASSWFSVSTATPPAPTGLWPKWPDEGWSQSGPSVTLWWDAVGGATNHEVWVEYWDGGAYRYYHSWTTGSGSSFTFWPAAGAKWYRWWVRAKGSGGWGEWSEGAEFWWEP